jgi:hypothetical protein
MRRLGEFCSGRSGFLFPLTCISPGIYNHCNHCKGPDSLSFTITRKGYG